MLIGFDGAKIHFFRHSYGFCGNFSVAGLGGREKEGGHPLAVAFGAALLVVSTAAQAAKIDKLVNG